MQKQKLPYETAVLILGLTAFVGCCCTSGFAGVALSIIGLVLAIKSEKLYQSNPDTYELGRIPTWKVINIIALVLSVFTLGLWAYLKITGQDVEMMEQFQEMLEEMQANQ
jgi:hypothetical protein